MRLPLLSLLLACSLLCIAAAQNAPQAQPETQLQTQPQSGGGQNTGQEAEVPPAPLRLPASVWLETGLAYAAGEGGTTELEPRVRFGVRGVQPLTDTASIYAAFSVREGLILDLGGWFSFLPGPDDLFGFSSFIGTGASFAEGSFGAALSAAVSYELSADTAVVLVYTHRPLLLPELGQTFDISVGVQLNAPEVVASR